MGGIQRRRLLSPVPSLPLAVAGARQRAKPPCCRRRQDPPARTGAGVGLGCFVLAAAHAGPSDVDPPPGGAPAAPGSADPVGDGRSDSSLLFDGGPPAG